MSSFSIFSIILLSVLVIVLLIIIYDLHVSSQILNKEISFLKEKLSLNEALLSIYKDCFESGFKHYIKKSE